MKYVEITLLVFAYTLLIVTIFLEIVCYKKGLEKWETIAFTLSLLLLIVSMTFSSFFDTTDFNETTSVFTLISMILVALTTPLNIMRERQHKIPPLWKKLLLACGILLFVATGIAFSLNMLDKVEYIIITFLAITVLFSMLLVRTTKPKQFIKHREKTERVFAIAFLVILPLSLLASYVFINEDYNLKIGFTLPLVFIFLAGNKFLDDLQRLSLFKPRSEYSDQHFKNYAISKREKDVALLLIKGKTYKQIAEELHISVPTVKTHTSTIYKKCGVKNRTELAALLIN